MRAQQDNDIKLYAKNPNSEKPEVQSMMNYTYINCVVQVKMISILCDNKHIHIKNSANHI